MEQRNYINFSKKQLIKEKIKYWNKKIKKIEDDITDQLEFISKFSKLYFKIFKRIGFNKIRFNSAFINKRNVL